MRSPLEFQASQDYFQDLFVKSRRKNISLRFFSDKLGYKNPRLVEMVCQGRRAASDDFLIRVKTFQKLTDHEFLYLNLLVQRERAVDGGKSTDHYDLALKSMHRHRKNPDLINNLVFRTIAEWPFVVLKQLFKSSGELDLKTIAERLKNKVTPAQVKDCLKVLVQLGFLQINDNRIEPRLIRGILTEIDIPSTAARLHHSQMMTRAQEALEEVSVLDREMLSLTFRFDPSRTEEIKRELRAFRDQLDEKYEDDDSTEVYQFNLQFFPHTRKV